MGKCEKCGLIRDYDNGKLCEGCKLLGMTTMKENKEAFEEWFDNRDMYFIKAMKTEAQPEYYCRTAWFHQQQKIDALNAKISHYDKVLESFCCCPENESIDAECPFCIAIKELGE